MLDGQFQNQLSMLIQILIIKSQDSNTYENKLGSSGISKYDGYDCIFNFAGGSTMRNKSCEFWVGLIPDKPFTNYARDIFEEHLAYKTLNDDTFVMETHEDLKAEIAIFTILEPYPGKFTGLRYQLMFWINIKDALIDGEPKCGEFYEYPDVCEGSQESYKPISNIHNHRKAFFVKIKLPEGITANSSAIGLAMPCFWNDKGRDEFNEETFTDYICFYWNSSFVYAFNSLASWGFTPESGHWDVAIQVDGFYIHENKTEIQKESGKIEFGFFKTTFFYSEYPRADREDHLLYIKNNYTLELNQTNTTNDIMNIVSLNIKAKNNFDIDTVFRIDFPEELTVVELIDAACDGVKDKKEDLDKLAENNYFSRIVKSIIINGNI